MHTVQQLAIQFLFSLMTSDILYMQNEFDYIRPSTKNKNTNTKSNVRLQKSTAISLAKKNYIPKKKNPEAQGQ